MANTSDWGKVYCSSNWGDVDNKHSIQNESAPDCLVEQVDCGVEASYSGGVAFPSYHNIQLGSNTGSVTLTFNAQNVPDKFELWFDGAKVIDTGYRGGSTAQADLDQALANLGLPSETIQGVGSGSASFTKSTATTTAQLRVYSPLPNNSWSATLSCPS